MAGSRLTAQKANDEAKTRLVPALLGRGAHLSFDQAIADFPDELINVKPPNVPYSFWHQVEHIRIAQWDLLEYIRTPDHGSPAWPREYWPPESAQASLSQWNESISRYRDDRDALVQLIQDPSTDVLSPVSHMSGRSVFRACLLVIDHTAYHLGEFVMARQVLGHWESELA